MKNDEMSEAYFRKNYIDPWLNQVAGYWFATTGVGARNGIPDYCTTINGRTVFIEVKRQTGKLSPYQVNEIRRMIKKKVRVYVVRPDNWDRMKDRILHYAYLDVKEALNSVDMSKIVSKGVYVIMSNTCNC